MCGALLPNTLEPTFPIHVYTLRAASFHSNLHCKIATTVLFIEGICC